MPRRRYTLPLSQFTNPEIRALANALNEELRRISEDFGKLEGRDSQTPEFDNDLDIGDHRVTNVAYPRSDKDAVNLGYLKEYGVIRDEGERVYVLDREIVGPPAQQGSQLVRLDQLEEQILDAANIDPTFSDVTASRTLGTVYQNAEDTMKVVVISVELSN